MTAETLAPGSPVKTAAATADIRVVVGKGTQVDLRVSSDTSTAVVATDVAEYLTTYLAESGASDAVPDSNGLGYQFRTTKGVVRKLDREKSLLEEQGWTGSALELVIADPVEEFSPLTEAPSTLVAQVGRKYYPPARVPELRTMFAAAGGVFAAAALVCVLVLAAASRGTWLGAGILAAAVVIPLSVWGTLAFQHKKLAAARVLPLLLVTVPTALALAVSWTSPLSGPALVAAAGGVVGVSAIAILSGHDLAAYTALALTGIFTAFSELFAIDTLLPGDGGMYLVIIGIVVVLSRADLLAQRLAALPIPRYPSSTLAHLFPTKPGTVEGTVAPSELSMSSEELVTGTIRAHQFLAGLLAGAALSAAGVGAVIGVRHGFSTSWLVYGYALTSLFLYSMYHFAPKLHLSWLLAGFTMSALSLTIAVGVQRGLLFALAGTAVALTAMLLAPGVIPTKERSQKPLIRWFRMRSENVVQLYVLVAPLLMLRLVQFIYNAMSQ